MAEMLEYPPMATFQVIERLRELRTAQVKILGMMATKSMPIVERARIRQTMQTHIDALGNAIEKLEGSQACADTLAKLAGEAWSERSLTSELKTEVDTALKVFGWTPK